MEEKTEKQLQEEAEKIVEQIEEEAPLPLGVHVKECVGAKVKMGGG